MIRGLEFSVPPPWPLRRDKGGGWVPTSKIDNLINCAYDEAPIKPQKDSVQRASEFMSSWRFGESSMLKEGMKLSTLFPTLVLCTSSTWIFRSHIPFIISWESSEYMGFLCPVVNSSKLIKPKEGLIGTCDLQLSVETAGNNLGLQLESEVEDSTVGPSPSPVESDAHLVRQCQHLVEL